MHIMYENIKTSSLGSLRHFSFLGIWLAPDPITGLSFVGLLTGILTVYYRVFEKVHSNSSQSSLVLLSTKCAIYCSNSEKMSFMNTRLEFRFLLIASHSSNVGNCKSCLMTVAYLLKHLTVSNHLRYWPYITERASVWPRRDGRKRENSEGKKG